MINWFYDCYQVLNKVYSEKTFVKQAINSTILEEKNRSLTIKTCYGVLDKDIELSYYIKKITEKTPKLAIRTILKIAMYSIKYLQKKPYAVTENAVELTKKLGKKGASGFVNAYLRNFVNNKIELPNDEIEYISVKYSFPKFAVEELLKYYGKERVEKILNVQSDYNTIVFYNTDGEKYLKRAKANYLATPFDNVYNVKNFVRNKDYDEGVYTFQSLGSVAICDIVEPCEYLLDCCAAPGGKSIRLSYKCNKVLSFDIHAHRVELINDYKSRMKRDNVEVSLSDATMFDENLIEKFDAVLCDAPCSGLGVTLDNPDIKLNRELENVLELRKQQLSILKNVSKYVKKGGYLYYSTCSILPLENIEIINQFMSDIKGFSIEKINSKLQHEEVLGTNQFLPDISNGVGFYVAKLKRIS